MGAPATRRVGCVPTKPARLPPMSSVVSFDELLAWLEALPCNQASGPTPAEQELQLTLPKCASGIHSLPRVAVSEHDHGQHGHTKRPGEPVCPQYPMVGTPPLNEPILTAGMQDSWPSVSSSGLASGQSSARSDYRSLASTAISSPVGSQWPLSRAHAVIAAARSSEGEVEAKAARPRGRSARPLPRLSLQTDALADPAVIHSARNLRASVHDPSAGRLSAANRIHEQRLVDSLNVGLMQRRAGAHLGAFGPEKRHLHPLPAIPGSLGNSMTSDGGRG
mmetsp:Transcript_21075/g.62308  ORF Transcript_21075/g.62308 Transcript_21075/m.62308 type:complete len:278 (+) Transcript_21075:92-925(+)